MRYVAIKKKDIIFYFILSFLVGSCVSGIFFRHTCNKEVSSILSAWKKTQNSLSSRLTIQLMTEIEERRILTIQNVLQGRKVLSCSRASDAFDCELMKKVHQEDKTKPVYTMVLSQDYIGRIPFHNELSTVHSTFVKVPGKPDVSELHVVINLGE